MSIVGVYPYNFVNGNTSDATQVDANFQYVADQVNANAVAKGGDTMTGTLNGTAFAASGDVSGATGTYSGNVEANGIVVPVATSGSFSGAASVAWTLAAGFKHYRITVAGLTGAATGNTFTVQFSYDGGATWLASGYYYTTRFTENIAGTVSVFDSGGANTASILVDQPWGSPLTPGPAAIVMDILPSAPDVILTLQATAIIGAVSEMNVVQVTGAVTGGHGAPNAVRIVPGAGTISGSWTRAAMNY